MPIMVSDSGGNFTPAPEGQFAAVCCDVVDLGMETSTYDGEERERHMVRLCWQIDEDMENGKPFLVMSKFNLTLNEKGRLRPFLESWRGKAFTEQETEGFDLESLIGVGALLQIAHNRKGQKVYSNINSIMKLPKGTRAPKIRDYVRVCEREGYKGPGGGGLTSDQIPGIHITQAQVTRLKAIQSEYGVADDQVQTILEMYGTEADGNGHRSTKLIPVNQYDAIIEDIKGAGRSDRAAE